MKQTMLEKIKALPDRFTRMKERMDALEATVGELSAGLDVVRGTGMREGRLYWRCQCPVNGPDGDFHALTVARCPWCNTNRPSLVSE